MIDYKIQLKLLSKATSYFYADTLNGIVLYYYFLIDRDFFDYLYQKFQGGEPPYVFSSILPSGYLPINSYFLADKLKSENLDKDKLKKIKKIKYLPYDWLGSLKTKSIDDFLDLTGKNPDVKKEIRVCNSLKNEQLFTVEEYWGRDFDLYLRVMDESVGEKIIDALAEIFSFYLGKKKSVGYNQFEVVDIKKHQLPSFSEYFLSLSAFCPRSQEKDFYEPKFFDFKIKNPMMGAVAENNNPFKRKIILVDQGSVFKTKKDLSFIGGLIKNINFANEKIIQVPITIPFYFNYE